MIFLTKTTRDVGDVTTIFSALQEIPTYFLLPSSPALSYYFHDHMCLVIPMVWCYTNEIFPPLIITLFPMSYVLFRSYSLHLFILEIDTQVAHV